MLNEVTQVARGAIGRLLRSRRAVVLGVVWLLGIALFAYLLSSATVGASISTGDSAEQTQAGTELALRNFGKLSEATIAAVIADAIPLRMMIAFLFPLSLIGIFVVLLGFDQIAGDIPTRSLRYFSIRVRRSSLVLGTLLAQLAIVVPLMLATSAVAMAMAWIVGTTAPVLTVFSWGARFALTAVLVIAADAAIVCACSAFAKTSPQALLTYVGLSVIFTLTGFLASAGWSPGTLASSILPPLKYLLPDTFRPLVLSPLLNEAALGVVGLLAIAVVATGIAVATFSRRDL